MKRTRSIFLLLAFIFAACGRSPVPVAPLGPDAVVLAFGDSLTRGTGASRNRSYPARLQKLIGCKVINAGVPGEVTAQGLARLPGLLDSHEPDLMILCHGGNDMLQQRSRKKMADNLARMIRLAQERGVEVILIGVPAPGLTLSTDKTYQTLAHEFHLPYEPGILEEILSHPAMKSDPLHPNAEGYHQLAKALAALITE